MKTTFIYFDFIKGAGGKYYEGIASISAVLKANNHQTALFHIKENPEKQTFMERFHAQFQDTDIIAFSATSNLFPFVKVYSALLKEKYPEKLTICGGPHTTLDPEQSIQAEGLNIICRGEGEYPLLDLCNCLEKNRDYTKIENLWIKKDGIIHRNLLRPLISDLGSLPHPDRDLFNFDDSVDKQMNRLPFMGSRGCPYNCTHCCNHAFKEISSSDCAYTRFKPPNYLIEEIKKEISTHPQIQYIHFMDDILTLKKKWFKEFIEQYMKEINRPYTCNCRFELLGSDTIDLLKKTNCVQVQLGLESGDPYIRCEVLKRKQSQKLIIDTCRQLHEGGIKFSLFNMVGIPYETMQRALNTVKLCAEVNPQHIQLSVFYPYAHTKLYEICRDNYYLTERKLDSYFEDDTVLNLPTFSRSKIIFAYRNFREFVMYYKTIGRFNKPMRFTFDKILEILWNHPALYKAVRFIYNPTKRLFKSVIRLLKSS
jgi:radical SAM superfamily enzyme YgiQ (UPF0313 family)